MACYPCVLLLDQTRKAFLRKIYSKIELIKLIKNQRIFFVSNGFRIRSPHGLLHLRYYFGTILRHRFLAVSAMCGEVVTSYGERLLRIKLGRS